MEFFDMQCFVNVVDAQSFSKAANAMFISQPALSKRILNLEKELGIRLLARNKHLIALTPAGKIFYF